MNSYFSVFRNWLTERTKPDIVSVWIIFSFTSASNQVEKVVRAWVSLSSITPQKSVTYPKSSPWLRPVAGPLHADEIRRGMPQLEAGCLQSRRPEPGRGVPVGAVFRPRGGCVRQRDSDIYRCSAWPWRARSIGGFKERGGATQHRAPLPNLAQPGDKTSRQRSSLRDPL